MDYQDIKEALLEADAVEQERLRLRQPHAWAQLQARMNEPAPSPGLSYLNWKWASATVLGAFAAMFVVIAAFSGPAAQVNLMHVNQPKVWATPFHNTEANADVIWLDGLPMAKDVVASR